MIISWNVTKRCNLYCEHCYRESENRHYEGELDTLEGKKLIEEIAKAGFKILVLSGGEPLLRKDIFTLAEHAKNQGLIPVLGTNGMLITAEVASKLKEAGVRACGISIDNLDETKHDSFRNTKGSFAKALEGIKACLDAGIRVQVHTTITKDNKEDIAKLVDFAKEQGATSHHIFFLVEVGRGKNIGQNTLEEEEYLEALAATLRKKEEVDIEVKPTCAPQYLSLAKKQGIDFRFSRGCIAGLSYCCVLPQGDVHICPYLPVKVGSVRQMPFDEIWRSSEIFNSLRDYKNYKGNCGSCKDIDICGGCRARAFAKTGDYLDEDPISRFCQIS